MLLLLLQLDAQIDHSQGDHLLLLSLNCTLMALAVAAAAAKGCKKQ